MISFLHEPEFTYGFILKSLLIGLLNPYWFLIRILTRFYTYLHPFRLAHFTFYHTFLGAYFSIIIVPKEAFGILSFPILWVYIFMYIVGVWSKSAESEKEKPNAQKWNFVTLGFFGMTISVLTLFGCTVAIDFRFCSWVFNLIYFLALCFFLVFYLMICNAYTDLYLILPPENRPFSGIKRNVVFLGLFHLTISIVSLFLTKFWPICCLLLFSSFIFSINAWACFFTDSYILCEHRLFEWDMQKLPVDGVKCHVAVRRNSGKMEDKTNRPIGF